MINLFVQIANERLDWFGFGPASINRTGAFVACLSIASLIFCAIPKKFSFILGLLGYVIFAYFLLLTLSRGAFVAWVCSSVFFLIFSFSKLGKLTSAIFLSLFLIIFVISIYAGIGKRFESLNSVGAIQSNSRTELYLAGLKMLSDSPWGVSHEPQDVYATWYQPENSSDRFLSLINSHLQFMTKHNVGVRLLYIFAWCFAFILVFPRKGELFNAICFSVFLCTFISGIFSNVLNYWVLWILPVLFLIAGLSVNYKKIETKKFWIWSICISIFVCLMLHLISYFLPRDARISNSLNYTVVNAGTEKAFILIPSGAALGVAYGRELVSFLKDKDFSVKLSENPQKQKYEIAIISSDFDESVLSKISADKIFILNAVPNNPANFEKLSSNKNIEVILGDMSDWRRKAFWKNLTDKNPNIKVHILSGVADYIPDWTNFLDGTFEFSESPE